MTTPRFLVALATTLLLAVGAGATPIAPSTNLSGTVHNGENHAGANGSNSLFIGGSFIGTSLSSVPSPGTFVNADFSSANLTSTILRNGNFSGAIFIGATFSATSMRDANFAGAVFNGVTLNALNVRGANFVGASFLGANLTGATNWALANWTGALFDASTVFAVGFDPVAEGMTFVAEPRSALLMGLGLLGLGVFGSPRRSS